MSALVVRVRQEDVTEIVFWVFLYGLWIAGVSALSLATAGC
jgi:hypothetical protein